MFNVHHQGATDQSSDERGEPLTTLAHASRAVIAKVLRSPSHRNSATSPAGPESLDELPFEPDTWPDVRRSAIISLAGDIAAWAGDSHKHGARCVLFAEVEEWAAGLVPVGVTEARLRTYTSVAALARGRFPAVMLGVVRDTFALVLTNWALINLVASEFQARPGVAAKSQEAVVDDGSVVSDCVLLLGGADVH